MKVHDIAPEKLGELFIMEDQEVVQTFSSYAPQKAFTHGIRLWSPVRRSKHFDATCCCYSCKMLPECAIIIPDQIFGRLPIWRRLPQLLRDPGIGGRSCHIYMDNFPRLQLDNEERKKWAKEEGSRLQEITGPHLCCMIVQECSPGLPTGSKWREPAAYTFEWSVYSLEYPA